MSKIKEKYNSVVKEDDELISEFLDSEDREKKDKEEEDKK